MCFDLDWTLCHYPLTTAEVFGRALARADLPSDRLGDLDRLAEQYDSAWLSLERDIPSIDELRRCIMIGLLAPLGLAAAEIAAIASAYAAVRAETGVRLYAGAMELLHHLGARYRLGLVTNGPSELQWTKLRSLKLVGSFDAIHVAGDTGRYKPDPAAFHGLLAALDVAPEEAVFVGDNYEADIVGAACAGLRTVWIRRSEAAHVDGVQPNRIATKLRELQEVFL